MSTIELSKGSVKILKTISEGGSGFVYLAERVGTPGPKFALKKIITQTGEQYESAVRELDFLKQYCTEGHPFFMNYFDSKVVNDGKGKHSFFILIELGSQGTLFDLMASRNKTGSTLSELEVLAIALAAAKSLQSLHAIGFAHLDVKIENFLFFGWESVKLCDFGSMSKNVIDFASISSKDYYAYEGHFEVTTTMMYRPPEICDPYLRYKVDVKADMWMLGCVIYTLMFFKHPFGQSSKQGICEANFAWPSHPVYSRRLESIVRNLLTPDPSLRPSSSQLIEILTSKDREVQLNPMAAEIKRESQALTDQIMGKKDRVPPKQASPVRQPPSSKEEFDFDVFSKKPVAPERFSVPSKLDKFNFASFNSKASSQDNIQDKNDPFGKAGQAIAEDKFAAFNFSSGPSPLMEPGFLEIDDDGLSFGGGKNEFEFAKKSTDQKDDLLKFEI